MAKSPEELAAMQQAQQTEPQAPTGSPQADQPPQYIPATMPREEQDSLVAKVWQDYRYALQAKGDLHDKWRKYESYYRNDQWAYKTVDPKRVKPTINYVFATIESLLPHLTSNSPDPIILPTHPDDEELATDLTKIVKIVMQKNNIEDILQIEERGRLKFGTGIWKIYFDPKKYNGLGDISFDSVDPVNFFVDPNCLYDLQKADYCMTVTKKSISYLKARYPDKAAEIEPDQRHSGIDVYKDQESDPRNTQATVIEYWRRTAKEGLVRVLLAGDTLLRYQPHFYAHGRYPFSVGRDYPVQKSFWGMGEAEQIVNSQDILNKLLQILIENVALANGQLVIDKNASGIKNITDLANKLWQPGLTIPVDDVNSIKKLDGIAAPGWIMGLIEMVQQEIQTVTGVSPIFMGMSSGSMTAASGILAMQEMATARVKLKLQEQARMIKEIAQFVIDYIVEFYSEERSFRYLEKNREPKWIQLKGSDLATHNADGEMVIPEFDVTLDVGFDTPMSRAYIEQQAMQLAQMGIIDGLEVMKTMNFPYKEEIMNRLQQKQAVMEQLASLPQGTQSPALNGQLAGLTALENKKPSLPGGMNTENTNSKQDASQQQQQMSPKDNGNGSNNQPKQNSNNA